MLANAFSRQPVHARECLPIDEKSASAAIVLIAQSEELVEASFLTGDPAPEKPDSPDLDGVRMRVLHVLKGTAPGDVNVLCPRGQCTPGDAQAAFLMAADALPGEGCFLRPDCGVARLESFTAAGETKKAGAIVQRAVQGATPREDHARP